ncbi:hypothetical protein ASPWEDRAFT_105239 [Aspergillus wentii DTO 134E9]|uniref:PHD-type domain-containing protein n=1 Tax=Aspergillus wentii DTO 134E9 TaxID=1073089 RepID=A0A1L9RWT1_ASPWE|nr:uncharacterized protein ASPWEDRAFT_105239 [Aspergillus wentii DTO 134E9]OJJ39334.1 hypothetical protein ASPWEDRAFT_105239 [Aspergillus wentii DTO 134E9]
MGVPVAPSQVNGSAGPADGQRAPTNPYETNPDLIPKDDPYLSRSAYYGRYAPHDDDFKPRYDQWHQSDPEATSYWEDSVKRLWTPENALNLPGAREAYAAGSAIIRVDSEPADGAEEKYSCINANELFSARKAEQTLKEIGIAVPVIYFYGTVEGKNVTVESRIPGVSLEVAWRYLTTEQINSIKKQCHHVVQRLGSLEPAPDSPSYVRSELNSQPQPDIQSHEKEILFGEKREAENLCLVHNDMVRSNIILKDDQIVGILGWRQSGFFGLERAKKVHKQIRIPEPTFINGLGENADNSQNWTDLYDNVSTPSGPEVKTEPLGLPLEEYPLNDDTEVKSAVTQLDGTDIPEEHPTPKKISNLKHGLASRASSSDRSSPANSTKPASSSRKSVSGATKKGTARKPPAKKRKINDQDGDSVDGRRSNTPSSVRGGKGSKSKKHSSTSASVAGSPAPENKSKGSKDNAGDEDEDDDDEDGGIFCICRRPDNHTWMIGCDGGCEDWFHGKCVNIDRRDADLIDKYICPHCKEQGKGWTTWKPMCRLAGCRKPARVVRPNPSKYCSDEHGREFMLRKIQHFNLGPMASRKPTPVGRTPGSAELDPTDGSRAANTPASNNADEADTPSGDHDRLPDDIGSRGGVLTAGDLKAVIMEVSSTEEFRRLGERIISPPPEEPEESENAETETKTKGNKKLGLDIDAKGLTYSADEASKIEKLRKQRDELLHRKDMLAARDAFLPLVRQRSKSILERFKQNDPKGGWKDICGFDSRLAWSDEEFDEWRLSEVGAKALKEGTPELLATSYPHSEPTDADGDTAMNGDKADEEDDLTRGVCTKKRCERHKQWVKVHQQENQFERDTVEADLTKCEEEAQIVVERAVLRMWAEKDNAHVGGN